PPRQGASLLPGRAWPAGRGGARRVGLRVVPRQRDSRLRERRAGARIPSGHARQRSARSHDVLRQRPAGAARRPSQIRGRGEPVLIGASLKRKEDRRLLTGAGRYVDDLRLPGMVHLALVRSPHAHARILRVDAAAALRLLGVLSVLTVRDAPELAASVPPLIREPDWPAYVHPVMAGDRARHLGEAVAVVVADDPYRAVDGAEAVVVEYEPLPVAAEPTVPAPAIVHDGWRDNRAGRQESSTGDVGRGFAEAEAIIEI